MFQLWILFENPEVVLSFCNFIEPILKKGSLYILKITRPRGCLTFALTYQAFENLKCIPIKIFPDALMCFINSLIRFFHVVIIYSNWFNARKIGPSGLLIQYHVFSVFLLRLNASLQFCESPFNGNVTKCNLYANLFD